MTNEKTTHKKNLEFLAKESYIFLQNLSPPIMDDIFKVRVTSINLQSLYSPCKNCAILNLKGCVQRSSNLEINL